MVAVSFGPPRPRCKHCNTRPLAMYRNKRGLCDTCDRDITIRFNYPLPEDTAKFAYRSEAADLVNPVPAAYPTNAEPGSATKMSVMATRLANGEELHHPLDPKYDWRSGPDPYTIPLVRDLRKLR